jgi:hypothetical protein
LLPIFRAARKHYPENGGKKLLRNVGNNSPIYRLSYLKRLVPAVYQLYTVQRHCTKLSSYLTTDINNLKGIDIITAICLLVVMSCGLVDNYEERDCFCPQNINLIVKMKTQVSSETLIRA